MTCPPKLSEQICNEMMPYMAPSHRPAIAQNTHDTSKCPNECADIAIWKGAGANAGAGGTRRRDQDE